MTPSLRDQMLSLMAEESTPLLESLLNGTEPFELADAFYEIALQKQVQLLGVMSAEHAADLLLEMNEPSLHKLLHILEAVPLTGYVTHMEHDDAADIVGMLNDEHAAEILGMLPQEFRKELQALLRYAEDSAGGLMDPDVVRVRSEQTVAEALETIRSYVSRVELDEFFSVFVLDAQNRLAGVIPNWKMLLAKESERIVDIMDPDVVVALPEMDQEEIARLVRDHDLVTLPVVDAEDHLIGRVTVDDVVDVIQEEYEEDVGRLTGTGREDVLELSIFHTLRLRAPWLLLALAGQFVSASILEQQEALLRAVTQLTFFIPLIMAMAGNAGIQTSTLVIRGLATGEVVLSHFWRRLMREILIAIAIGGGVAVILVAGATLMTGNFRIGISVGVATSVAILIAGIVGTAVPMLLKRVNIDPALATGPFITTLNDILGIAVYLAVAFLVLN